MVERFELAPGYSISRVLNGCWQLSNGHTLTGSLDLDDVMRAFRELVEQGFTTFDCADIYGCSEEFIGTLVQELKDTEGASAADKIQVHTKFVPDIDDLRSVDAAYVEAAIDRRVERAMQAYCAEHGIALICYGTLAGGFLAEKWRGAATAPAEPETRSQVKYLQVIADSLGWDGYQKLLGLLGGIAEAHGVSISNVATRFVLAQRDVAAAIVGVRNSRHVAQNAQIFSFELSDGEIAQIRSFIDGYPTVAGEPFEQERTPGSKYRAIMRMNENTADAQIEAASSARP